MEKGFSSHQLNKLKLHGWICLFKINGRMVWISREGEMEYTSGALLKTHWLHGMPSST